MIKVLFVCLGNICRSPMVEFIFKDMINKKGMSKDFKIKSVATNYEEIGNDMHDIVEGCNGFIKYLENKKII